MRICQIFNIDNARSKGFEAHEKGEIPFVSNGFDNSGVIGFVKPLSRELVFKQMAICVSAFCEATVQSAPFLPRGNGGSGLIVLTPKEEMSLEALYNYAAQINIQSWRFSFGRMVIGDRIKNMVVSVPKPTYNVIDYAKRLIPIKKYYALEKINFSKKPLNEIFHIKKGIGFYFEDCQQGKTPLVSASGGDNGVKGFVDKKPLFKAPMITVERVSGNAFVQLDDFITVPDDIFVLEPKFELSKEELFFYAAMINSQKWRFNYARKVTPKRFNKLFVFSPVNDKFASTNIIKKIVLSSCGWQL